MKVLLYYLVPFSVAHGGLTTQILCTRDALRQTGLEVEFLRWWDGGQTGEVLHFFGRIPAQLVRAAHEGGMKVLQAELLTEQGSRSRLRLWFQRFLTRAMRRTLPPRAVSSFHWDSYQLADACVALTEWEARLMKTLYDAPPDKVHVVPNGVEDTFLNSRPAARGPWLVCTATITERKRVFELAQAALRAQTPLWVIGEPYSESDAYARRFATLARAHPRVLRYEGPIRDRARLAQVYREARGFVLLSAMESLSLSALEAAACECPLLLSRLPWATTVFGQSACYCPITASAARTAPFLRQFYDAAPALKPPPRPLAWLEVGRRLQSIYDTLAGT